MKKKNKNEIKEEYKASVGEEQKVKKDNDNKENMEINPQPQEKEEIVDDKSEEEKNEELIIERIKEERKIPKDIKKKILSAFADCAISAIIVYVYFIFLELGIRNIHTNIYITDLRVFAVSLSIISVIFFEKAYNNKSLKEMYRGIEVIVLAILTLFIQYIILYLTPNYRIFIPLFGVIYNVYYIFKADLLRHSIKRKYRRDSNDIKEIIKKEKKI